LRIRPSPHAIAGGLLFVLMAVDGWRGYVRKHEAVYLLGSRRVADPEFLANDFTWSTLPPTTFLFDHLLAPLWGVFGDFGIVGLGRVLSWLLLAWALALLGRGLKLPPWSLVGGVALWLLWDQTIAACGRPLEGFQPKALAYPLAFFSLAFAIRGQLLRAGLVAGLASVFHIIIGGWACLALFASLLASPRRFPPRQVAAYLLGAAAFAGPLVLAVALFHVAGVSAEQRALMDEIYVGFSQPHCLDPSFFGSRSIWLQVAAVFPTSALLVLLWPEQPAARLAGGFLLVLIGVFLLGLAASALDLDGFLKLYPFQWGNSIPVLFLFVLCLAFAGRRRPRRPPAIVVWMLAVVVAVALVQDKQVFTEQLPRVPRRFVKQLRAQEHSPYGSSLSPSRRMLYGWIRGNTPPDSVFITPYLSEFWSYTGRSQVAALRHPPHDAKLIEWKRRLEELNGGPFERRGFEAAGELNAHQGRLGLRELIRMRDEYGATHYLTRTRRPDLARQLRVTAGRYHVHELASLGKSPVSR
jgi:hypothetical protein